MVDTSGSRSFLRYMRDVAPEGKSYCNDCREYKYVDEFGVHSRSKTGKNNYCKECINKRAKSVVDRYRTSRVSSNRMRNYGISDSEYNEIKEKQGGVCAICGLPETKYHKGVKIDLCVDHDHDTGMVRGLLCRSCNSGLGSFRDSADMIRMALDYLEMRRDIS